ncbi:uncharacterized protein EV420DRAFT_1160619 [Desarmillaria tabescens]|uniref:Crinkler (CRN) family protein n=1 Tax=Armillaria tabescens TaxID=1929756 RepID=A0AA39NCQ9_ARMTA|nr:uncharacterized protein EV420DRAFT_1160619 [Desarmillaria tabescens]KAK0463205.1 hypothetical protein EV420DRAFT_1160619 [Desarmillaria tabescens]
MVELGFRASGSGPILQIWPMAGERTIALHLHNLTPPKMPISRHLPTSTVNEIVRDLGITLPPYGPALLAEKMLWDLEYNNVYEDIWRGQQLPFIKESVKRDDPLNRVNVRVPEKTWVFSDMPSVMEEILRIVKVRPFIRREYEVALSDILGAMETGSMAIPVRVEKGEESKAEKEERDEEEEDGGGPSGGVEGEVEEGQDGEGPEGEKEEQDDEERDEEGHMDEADASLEQYVNPFHGKEDLESRLAGFMILGHPGIGKTIFLYYILLLRLQAKQPTILVTRPNSVTLFLEQGVFSVAIEHFTIISKLIPASAWCLVDSSDELKAPPPFSIIQSSFFIVQVTSARYSRIAWRKRTMDVHQYYMKPFTLSELIVGRNRKLRPSDSITESMLQAYYKDYTPSARTAYQYANHPGHYYTMVKEIVRQMSFDCLKKLVDGFSDVDILDENTSHNIVTITVAVGGERSEPRVEIPSRHLGTLLVKHLMVSAVRSAASLYYMFTQIPFLRSAGGYVLDIAMHEVLLHRSHWRVKVLTAKPPTGQRRNWHWTLDAGASSGTLCFPRSGGVDFMDRDATEEEQAEISGLTLRYLPKRGDAARELVDASPSYYFRPLDPNEATFDAVIFLKEKKRAVVFQATVSKKHTASARGFEYLKGVGVEELWYITVVPPGTSTTIPVAKKWKEKTTKVLQLEISDRDIAELGLDKPKSSEQSGSGSGQKTLT